MDFSSKLPSLSNHQMSSPQIGSDKRTFTRTCGNSPEGRVCYTDYDRGADTVALSGKDGGNEYLTTLNGEIVQWGKNTGSQVNPGFVKDHSKGNLSPVEAKRRFNVLRNFAYSGD